MLSSLFSEDQDETDALLVVAQRVARKEGRVVEETKKGKRRMTEGSFGKIGCE